MSIVLPNNIQNEINAEQGKIKAILAFGSEPFMSFISYNIRRLDRIKTYSNKRLHMSQRDTNLNVKYAEVFEIHKIDSKLIKISFTPAAFEV